LHVEWKDHFSVRKLGSWFADLFRPLLAAESYIITGQVAIYAGASLVSA